MNHVKKVCISLTEEQYEKLRTLAGECGRTHSGYIRHLVKTYLREIEARPDLKLK